jgi:ABC-type nickel/cobalt efflux system permease component RcnA
MDLADRLQSLVNASGFAPAAFLFALLAGAAHAVGPGHGKTLAAAYLVGDKGRARDAVWLSGSVALMHTVSVLVIAICWTFYSLSDLVRLTTLTTVLQLAAGLLTVGTGVWLLRRHLRGAPSGGVNCSV